MADDVGSMLLRAGLIAPEQLDAARIAASGNGGTVPEHLVQQGFIPDEELTTFYRKRLLIPRVNPSDLAKLRTRLLDKVPPDMAAEFRSIPVALDGEGNLTLVMSDPSDTGAVDEIGFFTGNYVVRAVATQAQIAWCLAHYYKQETKLYRSLLAQGEWPNPAGDEANAERTTEDVPQQPHPEERETGPMAVRKPKAAGRKTPNLNDKKPAAKQGDNPSADTRPNPVMAARPDNQQPSPPELFARAGEIRSVQAQADHAISDDSPAVVIDISPDQKPVTKIDEVAPIPTPKEEAAVETESTTADTAPILLTALRRKNRDTLKDEPVAPIVLEKRKRSKRRSSKQTHAGVGKAGSDHGVVSGTFSSTASKEETPPDATPSVQAVDAQQSAKKKKKKKKSKGDNPVAHVQARIVDLVGGDWGPPGTTIPPGFIGPVDLEALEAEATNTAATIETKSVPFVVEAPIVEPQATPIVDAAATIETKSLDVSKVELETDSAAPTIIIEDEASTTQMRLPDSSTPITSVPGSDHTVKSDPPDEVKRTEATDTATQLLQTVRSIDRANERETIVEALLSYLDLSFERCAFLAVRQDDLVSWRIHGCSEGTSSTISISEDSTFQDAVSTRLPYNGPLEDKFTKQLARDLDIPNALDLLVLPIALRERAIGVFVGLGSFHELNAEHMNVLSQATTEAFERIVLSRKR